jgi:glycosyltransferase involved in cell wall biosynthesis
MRSSNLPFVTILTPVYNGEIYLAECIESVLCQSYDNWEYIIANNCSTDSTVRIAEHYAKIDQRIHVYSFNEFVGVIESHNRALRLVSPKSKYCKVVSADDRITPDCVTKMVNLAEAHPAVGIVGSYQLCRDEVIWKGLSQDSETFSGRTVCRAFLLDHLPVAGNTTSSLYTAELIRKNNPFFPHQLPYADRSALFKYLQCCDFGFVHEVLSVQRIHKAQVTSRTNKLGMWEIGLLDDFHHYGPIYLTEEEFQAFENTMLDGYFRWLSTCILKMKPKAFWQFQNDRLKELGYRIRWRKVLRGVIDEIADEIQNPKDALNKLLTALKERSEDKVVNKSAKSS